MKRVRVLAGVLVLAFSTYLPPPASAPQPTGNGALDLALQRALDQDLADTWRDKLAYEIPDDYYLFSRTADTAPTQAQLDAAATQARRIGVLTRNASPGLSAARWKLVGPTNIGARVVDIAVDPVLKDTIYIAAASGGIWRSIDAGETFHPRWPRRRTQAMGALSIASDGTLYAGTGETNPGGGSLTYGGSGMYESTDRGKTWKSIGLKDSSTIARIAIDPKDSDHLFVAVSGNLFTPGGPRGLYETKDGGASWKRIVEPDNDTTGAADVVISPDGKTIYTAMWDHIRYPDWRDYAGPGSGTYRSTDGGKTFERLGPANGLPAPSEDISRIGVGLDPQNTDRVYAIYINSLGAMHSFWISTDGGDLWIESPLATQTLAASQLVYGWWFGRIWVDPKDSNHVFVAGVPLMESTNGGMSFPVSQGQMHVDHHAMAWDPQVKGRVYNGNDGGVYRSDKNGLNGSWTFGDYQPWVQFYRIDVSMQDPSRINGGLQDQGSVRSWGVEGREGWNHYNGGDGVENRINPKDKENVFACSQYGSCIRSDTGGTPAQGMDNAFARAGWLTPIDFQPGSADVMYWSGNVVQKSEDRGQSWLVVSPDLGKGDAGREQNPLYAAHYGTVQALGLNKAKPEVIYAGTDNGFLWKTTDGGIIWTELTSDALPARWVTSIAVKPKNPDVLYVTFSGYRQGDQKAYVLASKDGGATWKDITANLPKAPVNNVTLVGRRLYVAQDVGVFTKSVTGKRWLRVGRGLPNVPVNALRWVPKNKTLYAGTFGRAIWAVRLP